MPCSMARTSASSGRALQSGPAASGQDYSFRFAPISVANGGAPYSQFSKLARGGPIDLCRNVRCWEPRCVMSKLGQSRKYGTQRECRFQVLKAGTTFWDNCSAIVSSSAAALE